MRYKNVVAIVLVVGIVLGAIGGAIVLGIKTRQDVSNEDEPDRTSTGEKINSEVIIPPVISDKPRPEQTLMPETAEVELDVSEIERDPNPVLVGVTVEYGTKEMMKDEEP